MGIIQTDKAFVLRPYSTPALGEDANPGYTFEGWNTKADGSGTTIAGGSAYRPPNDITLYAQWKRKAEDVNVTVYSYNDDYSATFVEPDGAGTHTTTAQDNALTFTQLGQTGQLTVTSPGIFIQAAEGQTFGGRPGYVSLDGSTSPRTFNFTVGEFTQLYISKMPVEQELTLDGAYHNKTTQYGSGGTLFGGHKYVVHWYADYRYTQSGNTSTPSPYAFSREDKCFVNVAHKGGAKSHHMYVWLGYKDMQTGKITETVSFDKTGMA